MKRTIAFVSAILVLAAFTGCGDGVQSSPAESVTEQTEVATETEVQTEAETAPETESKTEANTTDENAEEISKETNEESVPGEDASTQAEGEMTLSQENALKTAINYLDFSAFSYTGLVEQLEFEEYSHEDAVFAVDRCGADWNEQAAKKAQSYLDFTSFSRDGLIEQLVYEGFTQEQAEYGVSAVGY